MTYIDFHTHTRYSDGNDDPATLVRAAKIKGIDALAITDHDTMKGYFEAVPEAKKWRIQLIPGVEITTRDYHILGLNVDPQNEEFQRFLQYSQSLQKKISNQRIELLRSVGVPITLEKLQKAFPESRLGKYNLVMTMIQDTECVDYLRKELPNASSDEIFTKFFRKPGIASTIKKEHCIESAEAIAQIHAAGGLAVIAHPFKEIPLHEYQRLSQLREEGLDGLEIQPNYGARNEFFKDYAQTYNMAITYGSDFHGACFARPLLGRGENRVDNLEELLDPKQHGITVFD